MEKEEKKLFLLDAMALIYRAYFALNKNPRINSKGMNTSAIVGFANTLYDVLKNEKPTHIGVAFDTMAPTERHIEFAAYKAHREAMPEELSASIPYIMELITAFNIPVLFSDGYEADDVIGTLAYKAEKQGFKVFMMTPDKDFGQLVTENSLIYKPAKFGEKATILGVKEICERFGIENTSQVKDILGLWGDASDNIPGIPGVGEVTAKHLIKEFYSVENLIENARSIKNEKVREKVIAHSEQALLSKKLATIILDVPIEFDEELLRLKQPDEIALKKLLDELEFRAFAKRVFTDISLKSPTAQKPVSYQHDLFSQLEPQAEIKSTEHTINQNEHKYLLTNTPEKRKELIAKLNASKSFCIDTETTGTDANNCELVGMSFSLKKGEAYYVPIPENYNEALLITNEFKPILENEKIEKIGQNIKYDYSVLQWYDIALKGKIFDTMVAHYLIEPEMRHNMDYLAQVYLDYKTIHIDELIGKKGKDQLSMRNISEEIVSEYACEDADITLQLKEKLNNELIRTETLKLFEEVEIPLIPVLAAMEKEGIKVDVKILGDYSLELLKDIQILEQQIYQLAGTQFNISSPKQLGNILYENLKITDNPKTTTKTKQYSTSEDVLQKLLYKHPIVQLILDYRSLTKLKSTYVDSLPLLMNPRTGRIHTSYNQTVTSTGRLSSNNPNLQNIPVRTERGREIRKTFVPRNENYLLLSADYSQIELRIIAELSGDNEMLNAFSQGLDIHTATAAKVYGVKLSDVTKQQRNSAKMVNFGIIYGISAFGLSERLGIPRREAAEIIEQYFKQYPNVKKYMEQSVVFAKQNGYVETLLGRRRYLRDINSNNSVVRGFAERNAINAPIQGTSADMIKVAMISIFDEFNQNNLKSKMLLQVHDELVFDVLIEEVEIVKSIVKRCMQNAIELKVPIEVEINTGKNWLEAH